MLKRLAMVAAVALLAGVGPVEAQDILPPENPYDPSGCNEYHQMRDQLDAIGAVPRELQNGDPADLLVVDPLYDMLSVTIVWSTGVFPCDVEPPTING